MMSAAHLSKTQYASDEEERVFEACWRRYQQGDTDILNAGVPPHVIDQELNDVHYQVIRKILDRLADAGVLVRLDGANPVTLRSRRSFAPAALYGGDQR